MKKLIERIRVKRKLKNLKKEADYQRKITGKQNFVVPKMINGKKDFGLMNNALHKKYNKAAKKLNLPQINYIDLLQMAVYKTKQGSL